jgi:hypothetical protein
MTIDEFENCENSLIFAQAHRIKDFKWHHIYDMNDGNIPSALDEDYKLYLKWHELYNSPLAKALREE